jgi:hypothetical protein
MLPDIVIPYRRSKYDDEELRYSLRGIDKYFAHDRIILVGEKPTWIKNIEFIECEDFPNHRESSIVNKILLACENGVSDKFVRWDDDHYILQETEIKYWWKNTTLEWAEYPTARGFYKDTIIRTQDRFGESNYFDIHTPMIFDRELFKEKMGFIREEKPEVLCKTTYCILNKIEGEEYPHKDLVINSKDWVRWVIQRQIEGRMFFATGNHGMSSEMTRVLNSLYPHKSKNE